MEHRPTELARSLAEEGIDERRRTPIIVFFVAFFSIVALGALRTGPAYAEGSTESAVDKLSEIAVKKSIDDDDDGAVGGAASGPNIVASPSNNTNVPAGGVAVLYPGDALEFMPTRFLDAWGSGIQLIGVKSFTALSAGDTIGLWSSRESYNADAIGEATMSPRRTFAGAAASFRSVRSLDLRAIQDRRTTRRRRLRWSASPSRSRSKSAAATSRSTALLRDSSTPR